MQTALGVPFRPFSAPRAHDNLSRKTTLKPIWFKFPCDGKPEPPACGATPVSEPELDANPGLVRSKNVKPPRGVGKIRLVCIGDESSIDSQPCGGTHVSETAEIGEVHIGKIEKKGRENRRMRIRFGPLPQN